MVDEKKMRRVLDLAQSSWIGTSQNGESAVLGQLCLICDYERKVVGIRDRRPFFSLDYGKAHENKCPCGATLSSPRVLIGV